MAESMNFRSAAGALLVSGALAALLLNGCGSSPFVVSVNELKAPLSANPDTSIFGPNAGTQSYDDAQIVVTNHAPSTATITHLAVRTEGEIRVTGVYLVASQGGSSGPQDGVAPSPLTLPDGTPVVLHRVPVNIPAMGGDTVLVRAHVTASGGVGLIESATLAYRIKSKPYVTTCLMPTVLCAGPATGSRCSAFHARLP
jgi:hypothetical protein